MPRIAIIGSGFGGLCMGIKLREAGIESFTIFEKADSVGGTWRANTYPGAECDIPSALYSFSFEGFDWPNKWSHQPVIRAYLEHCVEKFGLRSHLQFDTTIVAAEWSDDSNVWTLTTADGDTHEADVVVSATGQLSRPRSPDIPGLDRFAGPLFHSAEWDHSVDLAGKTVGVIGTGASAVQFVPEIARTAGRGKVTMFQRTPNWIVPKNDRDYRAIEHTLARRIPLLAKLRRASIWARGELMVWPLMKRRSRLRPIAEAASKKHLDSTISDPDKRAKLLPEYPMGAKRVLFSDTFYEGIEEFDVGVVDDKITEITPAGIHTADGTEHPCDVIVLGTGFDTNDFLAPMQVTGRHGADLNETWAAGPEAYLGMTVHGFPNLFFLYGPNTNLGHNSIVVMIEAQVRYILSALRQMDDEGIAAIDISTATMLQFNNEMQQRLAESSWAAIDDSWYLTNGKVTNNWAGRTTEYRRRTKTADLSLYEKTR